MHLVCACAYVCVGEHVGGVLVHMYIYVEAREQPQMYLLRHLPLLYFKDNVSLAWRDDSVFKSTWCSHGLDFQFPHGSLQSSKTPVSGHMAPPPDLCGNQTLTQCTYLQVGKMFIHINKSFLQRTNE